MVQRTLLVAMLIIGISLNQVHAESSQLIETTIDLPGVSNNTSGKIIEESIDVPSGSKNNTSGRIIEESIDIPSASKNNTSGGIIEESIDMSNTSDSSEQILEREIVLNNAEESESYIETTSFKLGNGLFEIVTCVLEFPKTIIRTSKEDGWTSGLTLGLVKGATNTVEQAVSGAVNVATFPVPQTLELDMLGDDVHDEMDFSMEQTFGAAFRTSEDKQNHEDAEISGSDVSSDY